MNVGLSLSIHVFPIVGYSREFIEIVSQVIHLQGWEEWRGYFQKIFLGDQKQALIWGDAFLYLVETYLFGINMKFKNYALIDFQVH